jgi:hypothetical protein
MAEAKPFGPAKLVCGIISSEDIYFQKVEEELKANHGPVDLKSQCFPFDLTSYYESQMGKNLRRRFLSFENLVAPERLSAIKLETNALEKRLREELDSNRRVANIDPGILTASSLIMATTKDFSHRIPLAHGVYAHLELLFSKTGVRLLNWTYPDFKQEGYQRFFLEARRIFLRQLKTR